MSIELTWLQDQDRAFLDAFFAANPGVDELVIEVSNQGWNFDRGWFNDPVERRVFKRPVPPLKP